MLEEKNKNKQKQTTKKPTSASLLSIRRRKSYFRTQRKLWSTQKEEVCIRNYQPTHLSGICFIKLPSISARMSINTRMSR